MAILVDKSPEIIVQNAQSRYAAGMIALMRDTGTRIVAGVAPGYGGEAMDGLALFDTVAEARAATDARASVIFTPPPGLGAAIEEAAEAGIRLAVAATEHAPLHDTIAAASVARAAGMWLVGPNSLGILAPGHGMLGALPAGFAQPGPVGLVSRSGTLAIVTMQALSAARLGLSTAVSMGGDTVIGRRPAEYLRLFADDPQTRAIVYIGEIGGTKEDELASALASCSKPVVTMIVGHSAPEGRTLGHAGALIGTDADRAEAKSARLAAAGAHSCRTPAELVAALSRLLGGKPS